MARPLKAASVAVLFALFWLPASAGAGQFRFTKSTGVRPVTVLSSEAFEARYGSNDEMPRSDAAVVALARRLFPPHWVRRQEAEAPAAHGGEPCGEHDVGLVFAALANPAISEVTREEVDALYAASVPPLPWIWFTTHFRISYTRTDPNPDHNVTQAQVMALGNELERYWNLYARNFREPKHYRLGTSKVVDVKVYDIPGNVAGTTNSGWRQIELDTKLAVRSPCFMKTTAAHELFHRVQYSYGYITGTGDMKWMVEGTATWSERYTNWSVGDYMFWMNQGLASADRNLVSSRDYDACHLWVFLEQRAGSWTALRDVWQTYSANGKDAKAALGSYVRTRFGAGYTNANFFSWWHRANLFKDFGNAAARDDYLEDERTVTSCGMTFGPLRHVPRALGAIRSDTSPPTIWSRSVAAGGADYYAFTISPLVTRLRVVADGSIWGNFHYFFVLAKGGNLSTYTPVGARDYTFTKAIGVAGLYDTLYVIVVGLNGGSYTLTVGP